MWKRDPTQKDIKRLRRGSVVGVRLGSRTYDVQIRKVPAKRFTKPWLGFVENWPGVDAEQEFFANDIVKVRVTYDVKKPW